MDMENIEKMRECFEATLTKLIGKKYTNSGFISKVKYIQMTNLISELKTKTSGKTPADYQRLKRYDVIKVGDCEKLIYPVNEDNQTIRYYICNEEIFDIMHDTHIAIGHGGRNRMMDELKKKYKNITAEVVMVYLNLCEPCQKKTKTTKKNLVAKPMIFNEINSRCQVDLINMQSQEDYEYKFILVYQDLFTKFVQLRPLKSERAEEVAHVLLDIFTIFGAPYILQSDNDREFTEKVIKSLCSTWEELKIVHGKPRHSQSQDSMESANQDIENMLKSWLETNQTSNWSEGLRFIQLAKNSAYHPQIKCSPYEAMFGSPIKVGLKTSWLPKEVIVNIKEEEELDNMMKQFENDNKVEKEPNVEDSTEIVDNYKEEIYIKEENSMDITYKE